MAMPVFTLSQVLAEEINAVFVALNGFGQDDVDVEDMSDIAVFGTVAFPVGIDALLYEKIIHGLGARAEEVLAGGGDEGCGIVAGDGLQNTEAGIVIGQVLTQIIQLDALSGRCGDF